ncbi:MAG: response regulator [Rudaea sp.]
MYRILLVDDEINVLAALKRVISTIPVEDLDGERPEIEAFASANAALKRIGEIPVDLVISDYRMPEVNGVDFLSRAIELQPDVARLLLSGYTDLEGLIGAINKVQISRFINKPWMDFELISAITQALAARAMAQENLRLSKLVREQQSSLSRQEAELLRLEAESPGITNIRFSADGGIELDEDDI